MNGVVREQDSNTVFVNSVVREHIWQHRSKPVIFSCFQIFSFSAASPEHPHAGPAALGCGSGHALRPLLRTPVPLMVALEFTFFRAPPRESPRGQPCGGGTPNRRCGSGENGRRVSPFTRQPLFC